MTAAVLMTSDGSSAGNNLTAGATEFWPVGNAQLRRNATETWMQLPQRVAGVYHGARLTVVSSASTSASTVTMRQNGADTAVSVSIGAALTGDFLDSDSFTVASGDTVNWKTVAAAVGAINFSAYTTTFTSATSTYVNMPWSSNSVNFTTASSTAFHRPGIDGNSVLQTTESTQQTKMRSACTAKNLYAIVSANARPATTVTSRKNTAAGAMSLSITASTTGTFEDTVGSDSLVATDLFCLRTVTGTGTLTMTVTEMGCGFESTAGQHEMCAGIAGGSAYTTSGATNFYRPEGDLTANQTSETTVPSPINGSFSMLRVHLSANARAVGQTATLRVNTTDTAVAASITASTTGYFEDTTHSALVTLGDRLSTSIATGASASSATIRAIELLMTPSAASLPPLPWTRRSDMRQLLTR